VLVGVEDVEAGVGEEAADGGDQPRTVGAGEEQSRCRALGDPRIIAAGGNPWICCRIECKDGTAVSNSVPEPVTKRTSGAFV
jgi:hypothetical protein